MSSLNQAFIKAYQRRGAAAPHIPLPPPAVADRAAARAAPTQHPPTPSAPATVRAFDQKTTSLPAAHLFGASPLSGPLTGRYAADDVPPLEPATTATADKTPPATSARSERTDAVCAAASHAALEPAYEVERFEWPAVVTSLCGEADKDLSALMQELLPDGRGALLVSGCRREEGRTSIALMLSRHLARSGSRIVLVDADFQRPSVAACLATDAEVGWEETLTAGSPEQAMIESLHDRLVVLPLRNALDDATPAASALQRMCGALAERFDVVCIDAGPLVEDENNHRVDFGDAPMVSALVVRDVRHSRLEQSHAVGRKLVQLGVRRWAIIENFA